MARLGPARLACAGGCVVRGMTEHPHRSALLAFGEALGSAASALRRDECGDPRINGRHEHIYACEGGYLLYVVARSPQAWTWAKKALAFARVTQDGDEEGIMTMDRVPTEAEAAAIRRYVGVRKRLDLSVERIEALRERGRVLAKTALRAGSLYPPTVGHETRETETHV